jgi:hypothetical protein
MNIVEAEMPSLFELYRKLREFAMVAASGEDCRLCYNSADSNKPSHFIMMSGVIA